MAPSTMSERSAPWAMVDSIRPPSIANGFSINVISGAAQENTEENISSINAAKMTVPHSLCVNTRSILSVGVMRRSEGRLTTPSSTRPTQS